MVVLAGPAQWLGHSRKKCDEACKERLQRFTNHPFALWESNNSDRLDSGSTLRACIVLFRSGRGQRGKWAEVQRPGKLQRVPPRRSRRCPLNSCAQVRCPLDRLPQANSAPIFDQNIHVEGVDYNGDDFSGIRSRISSAALGSSSLKSSCRFSSRILLVYSTILSCEKVETEPIPPGLRVTSAIKVFATMNTSFFISSERSDKLATPPHIFVCFSRFQRSH